MARSGTGSASGMRPYLAPRFACGSPWSKLLQIPACSKNPDLSANEIQLCVLDGSQVATAQTESSGSDRNKRWCVSDFSD
ncbi:unnamed protein product [Urochloa humidicola]